MLRTLRLDISQLRLDNVHFTRQRLFVAAALGVACKYVLCSRSRVELGGDVCSYKVLGSGGSALASEK